MVQDGLRRRNFKVVNIDVQSGLTVGGAISGGDIYSNDSVVGNVIQGGTISGANVYSASKVEAAGYITDFGAAKGEMITSLTAESVISGGMWVCGSAASGGIPVAIPLASAQALGVCIDTTASGVNPMILTRGLHDFIAEASLNNGVGFAVGAGAALNTVKATGAGLNRGTVVIGGGSEATVRVYLF